MAEYILEMDRLAAGYRRRIVLEDISVQLARGRIMTVIGPNGAGKSTLLKTIIRELAPLGGAVYLDGEEMRTIDEKKVARELSIVMTERVDPELLTCEDIVSYGRYPYTGKLGVLSEHDRQRVREAMEIVHIEALRDTYFSDISDGQRQRVMLARAICQEPAVMILDEPTSFLDIRHKLELLSILKELAIEKNIAVLMTLHELDLAQKISDEVLCVKDGRVVLQGPPEAVFTREKIDALYDLAEPAAPPDAADGAASPATVRRCGSYLPAFGSLELRRQAAPPQVFVIGGGGRGIPVYRQLWRRGVPFAAGVLHENDLDYPVAEALAAKVVTAAPFAPVSDAAVEEAAAILRSCRQVLCALDPESGFGPGNAANRRLLELAQTLGTLEQA